MNSLELVHADQSRSLIGAEFQFPAPYARTESPIYRSSHIEGPSGNNMKDRNDFTNETESNSNRFENIASWYDDGPGAARVSKVVVNAVTREYDFDEESVVLMG